MTGVYMTPWPLTVAVAAPLASRLAKHLSTAWLCAAVVRVSPLGSRLPRSLPLQGNLLLLVPITMLCGLGFGLFQVPNNHNMFLSAPRERSGAAGGMQGTARLAGQTTGAIIMTLLFHPGVCRRSAPDRPRHRCSADTGSGPCERAARQSARQLTASGPCQTQGFEANGFIRLPRPLKISKRHVLPPNPRHVLIRQACLPRKLRPGRHGLLNGLENARRGADAETVRNHQQIIPRDA